MSRRRGIGTAAACALLVLTTACGRFQAADSQKTTTSAGYTGQTLPPLDTTSTARRAGTGQGGAGGGTAAPTPTRAPRDRCAPPNQSVRDDPSGFRLILTVAPMQCVSKAADVTLQLEIQNIGKSPLQYDSNQDHFFDIQPEGDTSRASWSDRSCHGVEAHPVVGGPLTLQPGEREVRAKATYPGPTSSSKAEREQCRTLDGLYDAVAQFEWCPPGSVTNGVCDRDKEATIVSAPMPMRVS
jgi:hypothetical protein